MNKTLILILAAALSCLPDAWGQTPPVRRIAANPGIPAQEVDLPRFDLDFPGGTPRELVSAIERALGQPLNAIVPDEHADLRLPPLKMSGVNVADLFSALSEASSMSYVSRRAGVQGIVTGYFGFRTPGALNSNSV